MREIERGVYSLTKREYEGLKSKACMGQNNNSPDRIISVSLLNRKDHPMMDMIVYDLSLWAGSRPSYMLYKHVDEKRVEEISGIPFDECVEAGF